MARQCSICESIQLKAIDKALVNNESIRTVASRFDLSTAAVQRHKVNHLPKLLVKAKAIEEIATADSLLDQAKRLLEKAERLTKRAEEDGAIDTALRGVSQIRGVLELLGTVSGQLAGKGTTVNVGINIEGGGVRTARQMSDDELDAEIARLAGSVKGVVEGVSDQPELLTIDAKLLKS